jgi:hypothetical protein
VVVPEQRHALLERVRGCAHAVEPPQLRLLKRSEVQTAEIGAIEREPLGVVERGYARVRCRKVDEVADDLRVGLAGPFVEIRRRRSERGPAEQSRDVLAGSFDCPQPTPLTCTVDRLDDCNLAGNTKTGSGR